MTFNRHTRAGGKHATKKGKKAPVEVESLRLGRYPGKAGVNYYVSRMKGRWRGKTTFQEEERKLRQEMKIFENLRAEGLIPSTDPRHITEDGVILFLAEISHMNPDSQRRHISRLNRFLKFFKNFSLETMLAEGRITMPRCAHHNIRSISIGELREIFAAADRMDGWHGVVNRGMLALYMSTGLRPSELRLAEYRDLDLRRERLYVRNPKGLGSWAAPEWVDLIRGDMLPWVVRYVEERHDHVRSCGKEEATYLFPNLYRGDDSYYSANSWRRIKQHLVEETHIDFRLKDLRSTLCSLTVNEDLSRLPAMSVQLRHSSPVTTSRYYAAIDRANAGKQLKRAWKESRIVAPEHPVIEKDSEVTGWC